MAETSFDPELRGEPGRGKRGARCGGRRGVRERWSWHGGTLETTEIIIGAHDTEEEDEVDAIDSVRPRKNLWSEHDEDIEAQLWMPLS